jgi:predicted nucleic-acid-binding protein
MTGADTNLIVRFLTRDVENQAQKVKELLKRGEILYINENVLAELYWVLVRVYGYSRIDFIRAIDVLLETEGFRFFDNNIVRLALADYIHSAVEFSDCLIHRINAGKNILTFTFDKKASQLDEMKLLQ